MSSRSPSDRHERRLADRRAIDEFATVHQFPVGKQMILEHRLDGLQVEFRRQIQTERYSS